MRVLSFGLALAAAPAYAHSPDAAQQATRYAEPWLAVLLALACVLYVAGVARLWRKAGIGRGIARKEAASFALGVAALIAALFSPLDPLGATYFSAHMVQHEILMVVAAPLFVLGRPVEAWTWGTPMGARRALHRAVGASGLAPAWDTLTKPLVAWSLHAAALWGWHVPALFDAAIANEAVHVAQHLSFLGTALLFWSAMMTGGPQGRAHATCVLGQFTTMIHTGALGALLTFSSVPWYAAYRHGLHEAALGALEDQQLGGLIMWIPGALAYLVAALASMAALLMRRRPAPLRCTSAPTGKAAAS